MSFLRTVEDLRADALFRAGEPPTDTTGSFWTKSIEYLNRVQQALLLGGSIAVGRDLATSAGIYAHLVDLPLTDWWWSRKLGVFNTVAAIQITSPGLLQSGFHLVGVSNNPITTDIRGHYIIVANRPTVLRAAQVEQAGNVIRFDEPYTDDDIINPPLTIAKMEYDLPPDFLRFSSTPYVHSPFGAVCDVGSLEQRNIDWPLSLANMRQARPTRSFLVAPQRIAMNAYDIRAYRIEFEYIAMPVDLGTGGTCVLPLHHRSVLASGAAMLMCFDKGDGRAANLASEFRETVGRMVQEHRRAIGGGSSTFGQFRTRQYGTIRRSPQTFGELFLV